MFMRVMMMIPVFLTQIANSSVDYHSHYSHFLQKLRNYKNFLECGLTMWNFFKMGAYKILKKKEKKKERKVFQRVYSLNFRN